MEDLAVGAYLIPAAELEEIFETPGGPGGQHANRNATAVRLRFDVASSSLPPEVRDRLRSLLDDVVEVIASDTRSQFRNRALARRRLKERIESALVEAPDRRPTRPTRASRQQRVAEKRARSEVKRLRRRPGTDE